MQFINLTPKSITELTTNQTFKPSGTVVRLDINTKPEGFYSDIPVFSKNFGQINNLPEPQPDTIYIIPGIMLEAAYTQGRTDVVAPGELVKQDGKIIGCNGFTV